MLMLSPDYRDGFSKFTAMLSATSDAEKSFEAVYHKKTWEIEVDMNAYYHASKVGGVAFKTRFEKIKIDPAEPATDLELGLTLAKLKTMLGRYDEAAARYSELAKAHPQSAEIEEALAYLAWRQNHRDDALTHFDRAIKLGAATWKTYWDYARLRGPKDDAGAFTDALRKTLELKPDMLEARMALGSELVRERSWAQGLVTLREIKNIDGEHAPQLFLLMAYCAMNLKQDVEAKSYATSARKYAKEPKDQEQADQLLSYVDRRQNAVPAPPKTPAPVSEAAPADTTTAKPKSVNVTGNFKRLDCVGDLWRMHVNDGTGTLMLLLRQLPLKPALKCGPQNLAVSVDYVPGKDPKFGTAGEVLHVEFVE